MMRHRREGAALVLALLVLLVLECVVVGTLHLTRLERRLADNGTVALRLRLAAETAARAAAGEWPSQLDSLLLGDVLNAASGITADGLATSARYQRVDSSLVLVFAEAAEPPPRFGRARASLLVEPPLLTEAMLPRSALSAAGSVRIQASGGLNSQVDPACIDLASADALQLASMTSLTTVAGGTITGNIAVAALSADWPARIRAIAAIAPPATFIDSAGRTAYAGSATDLIAVDGDLVIPANASVRGIILVAGTLIVEQGAFIEGSVVVLGDVDVHGAVRFSSCFGRAAIRQKSLHRPRPHPRRAAIPGF